MEKKIRPRDLRAEAQRLLAAGRMPTLAELVEAIEKTRSKYRAAGYKVSGGILEHIKASKEVR